MRRGFFSLVSVLGFAGAARAQEPLTPVSPLASAPARVSPANLVMILSAAQRAQDLGIPWLAVGLYRQARDVPGADRGAITMSLVTALLDANEAAEAEKILAEITEPHGAAWHVRAGLAALQLKKRAAAQAAWDAINPDEVSLADKPWYWFLGGALYDTATPRDEKRANQLYNNAEFAATTELSKARFQLAGERVRLSTLTKPTEAEAQRALEGYRSFQGQVLGYQYARYHAVVLTELEQRDKAVDFLTRAIAAIPAQDRQARDDMRLFLGVLGNRERNGAGRNALTQLLESGQSAERQRQALQLLAAASAKGPEREDYEKLLNKFADAKPDHPIKETLLYFRAQLELGEKDYPAAERDAVALLKQFPVSQLKVHALGLLAQSAWEQRRYRQAANYAGQAQTELTTRAVATTAAASPRPPIFSGKVRADLGVLEAEAYFRALDYRNSADAYAAVLRQQRADLEPSKIGALMFQRVLAEIRAQGDAAKVLDELTRDPAFDVENRWQAEWHLARDLQTRGPAAVKQALTRVTMLLDRPMPAGAALKPDLHARIAWLQAQLALDSGDAEQAVRRVEALLATPLAIEQPLKDEIASMAVLLKARAEFALTRAAAALETLKRLRETYAKTEAAVSSFLIESEYYADRENLDEARKTLVKLIDNTAYKNSDYVPDALFRLALLSERLGGEQNLRQAIRRIEEMVELEIQGGRSLSPLMFRARLEQGHIFRKLNDFPSAQRAYEEVVNKFSQRADVVYAQLALAECHNAQSATDRENRAHADLAQSLFEQIRDRFDAPLDVRVEAGYNLGKLLERRGKLSEAAKVWWVDVITPFLVEDTDPLRHAAKRPWWLARTLVDVGDVLQRLDRSEEAKQAYLLLLKSGLPNGEAIARVRLEQLGVPTGKSGQ
jgi:cellulose synthase operon protein C